MGDLKNSLNLGTKTHTLKPEEIAYLQNLHVMVQAELDMLQERIAATFLHHVAKTRFGYTEGQDLRFSIDASKTENNLSVTQVAG